MPQRRRRGEGRAARSRASVRRAQHQERRQRTAPSPPLAAAAAETPKISTGIASGKHQHRHQQAAAPQRNRQRRADRAEHGEGRRAGERGSARRPRERLAPPSPASGRTAGVAMTSGRPVDRPMGGAFDQHDQLERQVGVDQHGRASRRRRRAWNRRSRPSSVASSAAIHRIAGPIRASRLRSGPIAKGMIVTRMRKNTAPIAAPPPMRRAMRHSRRNSARAAPLTPRSSRSAESKRRARRRARAAHGSPRRSGRRRRGARA